MMILDLFESGQGQKAVDIFADWLAFDTYPEYRLEMGETIDFLHDIQGKMLDREFEKYGIPLDEGKTQSMSQV
jgi:hypothetical protein